MKVSKINIEPYEAYGVVYHADTCLPLIDAFNRKKLKFKALARHTYPGDRLDNNTLGLNSIGYWDANEPQDWGLDWHRNDPVDAWEENRNDIIYYSYQNNRNPFIDFPNLAEYIWGIKVGSNWTEEGTLDFKTSNEISFRIYPNPSSGIISIKGLQASSEINIYDTIGRKALTTSISVNNNTIDVSRLNGIYLVQIITQGKRVTKRLVIH